MMAGPPQAQADFRTVLLACPAMGTRFELVLIGDDEVRLRAAGEAAIEEILDWHRRLNWFDAGSFLSFVNAQAGERAVECDGEFFELLLLCLAVWRDSKGAFDPAVAAMMRAAGFRDRARDPGEIAEAVQSSGFDKVECNETRRTVRFTRPGVGLDFGAIGKGWALDRARATLADAGVTSGLIHGGTSSVLGLENPPGQPGWAVGVGHGVGAPTLLLRDSALGVSAPHGRTIVGEGADHGHVLDPRTGRSVHATALSAVIADSAALADAWSTAALVQGDRPAGMPAAFTCVLAPLEPGGAWRITGAGATTLCTCPTQGLVQGTMPARMFHD